MSNKKLVFKGSGSFDTGHSIRLCHLPYYTRYKNSNSKERYKVIGFRVFFVRK